MRGHPYPERSPEFGDAYVSPQTEESVDLTELLAENAPTRRSAEPTRTTEVSPRRNNNSWIKKKLNGLSGWRVGAICFAAGAFMSLLLNIILAVWVSTLDSFHFGVGVIWTGSCKKAGIYNTIIHLGINGISTMLLSGSNYCMQCLTAPTRPNLQRAHSKGIWLDIGVLSIRNLKSIGRPKVILWFLLGISSVPLHLMYNSAFFSSLDSNSYQVYVVSEDFWNSTEAIHVQNMSSYWNDQSYWQVLDEEAPPASATEYLDEIKHVQSQLGSAMENKVGNFEDLSVADCINKYAQDFITGRRTLVLTTDAIPDDGPFAYGYQYLATLNVNASIGRYKPYDWMCFGMNDTQNQCYLSQDLKTPDFWWSPWGFRVGSCYSEIVEENCALNASQPIMLIIIVCNLIKLIIMTMMAFGFREQPIVTLGDAMESFLDEPDPTTEGLCLLSKDAVEAQTPRPWPKNRFPDESDPTAARKRWYRWSDAVSARRWKCTLTALGIAMLAVVVFLGVSIDSIKDNNTLEPFSAGFGSTNAAFLISSWAPSTSKSYGNQLLVVVIIANTPQIVFSAMTFSLNGLLTIIYSAREWENFSQHRKTLRVSQPRGGQRSTYFLQLPYRIAVPFSFACGLLSWLLSLSIFPIVISSYDSWGSLTDGVHAVTCGFSPSPMVMIIVVMFILFVGMCSFFFFHFISVMPMAGTCSAVISAACHHGNGQDEVSLQPVKWGAVFVEETEEEREWVGHCCFTSSLVKRPKPGLLYAGKKAACKRK